MRVYFRLTTVFQYSPPPPDNFAWFRWDILADSLQGFNAVLMGNKFCWVPCICPTGHFSARYFVVSSNGKLQTLRNWFMSCTRLSLSLSLWVYITCLHEGTPPPPPTHFSRNTSFSENVCSFFCSSTSRRTVPFDHIWKQWCRRKITSSMTDSAPPRSVISVLSLQVSEDKQMCSTAVWS